MLKNCWDILLNYESHDLTHRKYEQIHKIESNSGCIKEINSCFIQAREYFHSAHNANRSVKPLLLYYGVMSLGRGCTLFLTPRMREASFPQTHGITTINWANNFGEKEFNIANLRVKVRQSGTLIKFIQASGNFTPLRLNTSAINYQYYHSPVKEEFTISLGDILSRLPELREQYNRWLGFAACFQGDILEDLPNMLVIKLLKIQDKVTLNQEDITKIFKDYEIQILDESDGFRITLKYNDFRPIYIIDYVNEKMLNIGSLFIVLSLQNKFDISKIVMSYILSYFLGMLVRYFPSKWMSLVRNEKGDSALPTLLNAISYIENYFPSMIIDLLEMPQNVRKINCSQIAKNS